MVNNTGRTPDTRRIRRLKSPSSIEVEVSAEDVPLRLRFGGVWQEVTPVRPSWRIDQYWWRSLPIGRIYYRVTPADGPALTVYRDLINGEWFRQEYR